MQKLSDETISQYNLLSDEEVSILKIKTGKNHRTEKDWNVIKDLLSEKSVITMNSMNKKLFRKTSIENIFTNQGFLLVFSNIDDCINYVKWFNQQIMRDGSFEIGTIPLKDVLEISDRECIPVAIDINPVTQGHFIYYQKGKMTAGLLPR